MNYAAAGNYTGALNNITDTLKWAAERQDRQAIKDEETRRWDITNERAVESHKAGMEKSAVDLEVAQRGLDKSKGLDDVNYTSGLLTDLISSYDPSDNTTYAKKRDALLADPKFTGTISKVPELRAMLEGAEKRATAYQQFGSNLHSVTNSVLAGNNPDLQIVGDRQSIGGQSADTLFQSLKSINPERFPYDVVPGSVQFTSPKGQDKWALQFQYKNQNGEIVNGTATTNRTMAGTPGAENDTVVLRSIPEMFDTTQQRIAANMVLADLNARANFGDTGAKAAIDQHNIKKLEKEELRKDKKLDAEELSGALAQVGNVWDDSKPVKENLVTALATALETAPDKESALKAVEIISKAKEPTKTSTVHAEDNGYKVTYVVPEGVTLTAKNKKDYEVTRSKIEKAGGVGGAGGIAPEIKPTAEESKRIDENVAQRYVKRARENATSQSWVSSLNMNWSLSKDPIAAIMQNMPEEEKRIVRKLRSDAHASYRTPYVDSRGSWQRMTEDDSVESAYRNLMTHKTIKKGALK